MLKKIVIGAILVGSTATIPFYISGQYAAERLTEHGAKVSQMMPELLTISNIEYNSGIYQSDYNFDVQLNLTDPQLLGLNQLVDTDTITFRVNNHIGHGLLNVTMDTTFTDKNGDLFKTFKDQLTELLTDKNQPLFSLKSEAKYSINGQFSMTSTLDTQALNHQGTEDGSGDYNVNIAPIHFSSTLADLEITTVGAIENLTFTNPLNTLSLRNIQLDSTAQLQRNLFTDPISNNSIRSLFALFKNQQGNVSIAAIDSTKGDKTTQVMTGLNINSGLEVNDQRTIMSYGIKIEKAGTPDIAITTLEQLDLSLEMALGSQAMGNYMDHIAKLDPKSTDPQQVFAIIGQLLTEDINVTIKTGQANTHFGPVAISGDLNIAAIPLDDFVANPATLVSALSYKAQVKLPKDLLLMSGQTDENMIDELVDQQMIELKDDMVTINVDGQAGHVNLNGKPIK